MGTSLSKQTDQYEKRLIEIESINIDRLSLEELKELCHALEIEMSTLDSKKASKLPEETRDIFKQHYLMIIQVYKDTVRATDSLNELISELTKLKAPIYTSQEATFERQISTARQELEELKSNETIGSYHIWDFILKIETELKRLDKEVIINLLSRMPQEIRISMKYPTKVNECRNIVKCYELIPELRRMKAPTNKSQETTFERQISTTRQELKELKSNEIIDSYHKRDLIQKYETELKRLAKEVTDQFLNVEVRDSIDLIEKTLAEPHLYSLPHLIMWRNTAQEKIQKIKNFPLPIPQKIVTEKIEKYESLIIKLRAEILKLRTYPIPETWCSHCMRVELTHLMKGEFIFFVHPGIEEDMRTEGLQLVTPASVVVHRNTVFVADKYGHSISYYRDRDLEAIGSYHHTTADTPVSITVCEDSLYACYSNELVQFSLSWGDKYVESNQFKTSIEIPQICCIASDYKSLFVGTLKPSLIRIDIYTLQMLNEYQLNPIRYHTYKTNRYPWLQDMKATRGSIFCLFTGSPSPLQQFSHTGELRWSVLTEDEIVGAYHFNVFWNPVTDKWRIYITDFWNNAIKVFDKEGQFIETFSKKGFGLGQIIQPTGLFVEESGFITVCDMKEDNCLQRL